MVMILVTTTMTPSLTNLCMPAVAWTDGVPSRRVGLRLRLGLRLRFFGNGR